MRVFAPLSPGLLIALLGIVQPGLGISGNVSCEGLSQPGWGKGLDDGNCLLTKEQPDNGLATLPVPQASNPPHRRDEPITSTRLTTRTAIATSTRIITKTRTSGRTRTSTRTTTQTTAKTTLITSTVTRVVTGTTTATSTITSTIRAPPPPAGPPDALPSPAGAACVAGTAAPGMSGNYMGLCSFACGYDYCPPGPCACTAYAPAAVPAPARAGGAAEGCPLPGEDESYRGLCSFACSHGYCPPTACSSDCARGAWGGWAVERRG